MIGFVGNTWADKSKILDLREMNPWIKGYQANLSKNEPLDEAWVSYEISDDFSLSFGQMLSFINNKELMFREDKIQFNHVSSIL